MALFPAMESTLSLEMSRTMGWSAPSRATSPSSRLPGRSRALQLDQKVKALVLQRLPVGIVLDGNMLDIDHPKGLVGRAVPVHSRDRLADTGLGDGTGTSREVSYADPCRSFPRTR